MEVLAENWFTPLAPIADIDDRFGALTRAGRRYSQPFRVAVLGFGVSVLGFRSWGLGFRL